MDLPVEMQCNNDCISCIFDTRQMRLMRNSSTDSLLAFLKKEQGEEPIGLTGGEPTLRKDFFTLLKRIRENWPDKYVFLVSNGRKFAGLAFSKKLANLKMGNFKIGIPLFSHNAKVHDAHTQVKGSFNETVEGIKNLIKLGVEVELRVLVTKMNYRELKKTAEFIAKNFKGVFRVVFINLKYTGNAFIYRKKIFVKYSELAPYAQDAARYLINEGFYVRLFHFPLCTIDREFWEIAEGISKQEEELRLLKKCKMCKLKDRCPRIWISYPPLAGTDEFKPALKI